MMGERCETCRFWKRGILKDGLTGEPTGPGDHGICRRSPAIYLHDEGWFQPCMMQDDWCGEYQPEADPGKYAKILGASQ